MMQDMAVTPRRAVAPLRELRRDPEHGIVAGVCSGLGRHLDIDPLLLRIAFGAMTFASGVGIVAYLLAWMLIPAAESSGETRAGAFVDAVGRTGRAALEVAAGVGFLEVRHHDDHRFHDRGFRRDIAAERNAACTTTTASTKAPGASHG